MHLRTEAERPILKSGWRAFHACYGANDITNLPNINNTGTKGPAGYMMLKHNISNE
jgi:hypothetical protein